MTEEEKSILTNGIDEVPQDEDAETLDATSEIPESDEEREERLAKEKAERLAREAEEEAERLAREAKEEAERSILLQRLVVVLDKALTVAKQAEEKARYAALVSREKRRKRRLALKRVGLAATAAVLTGVPLTLELVLLPRAAWWQIQHVLGSIFGLIGSLFALLVIAGSTRLRLHRNKAPKYRAVTFGVAQGVIALCGLFGLIFADFRIIALWWMGYAIAISIAAFVVAWKDAFRLWFRRLWAILLFGVDLTLLTYVAVAPFSWTEAQWALGAVLPPLLGMGTWTLCRSIKKYPWHLLCLWVLYAVSLLNVVLVVANVNWNIISYWVSGFCMAAALSMGGILFFASNERIDAHNYPAVKGVFAYASTRHESKAYRFYLPLAYVAFGLLQIGLILLNQQTVLGNGGWFDFGQVGIGVLMDVTFILLCGDLSRKISQRYDYNWFAVACIFYGVIWVIFFILAMAIHGMGGLFIIWEWLPALFSIPIIVYGNEKRKEDGTWWQLIVAAVIVLSAVGAFFIVVFLGAR